MRGEILVLSKIEKKTDKKNKKDQEGYKKV